MPIRCECGHCKTEFWAPDKFAGRTLACPVCDKRVSAPGGERRAPEPVQPEPLASILDEEMGSGMALAGGVAGHAASPHLDDAWANDGTWQGARRRSRREIVRIPLQAGIAIFAIGVLVFYLVFLAAEPKIAAVIGWVLFAGGLGLIVAGWGWEALVAMREGTGQGICIIVVPFYTLYYFMNRWDKTHKAFLTALAGVGVCLGSLGTIVLADYLAGRQEEQAAGPQKSKEPVAAAMSQQPGAAKGSEDAAARRSAARTPAASANVPSSGAAQPSLSGGRAYPATATANSAVPAPVVGAGPFGGPPASPGARAVASAPPAPPAAALDADPAMDPVQRAYEVASRDYAIKTAVDLIAGEDSTLLYRVRWFPAGNRPVIGLRWGLGVEVSDPADPAARAAVKEGQELIGSVAMAVIGGLETRIKAGAYGEWPDQGDPRCRQVAILRTGTRQQLLAAARSRRLDMLIFVQPVPLSSSAGQVSQTLVQAQVFDVIAEKALRTSQALGGAPAGRGVAGAWDPVAAQVTDLLEYLRTRCELVPVPDLTAEQVRARMKQWEPEKGRRENGLLLLVELRYYQLKQLLPAEEVAKEQDALVGLGRGRLLATEPPLKRRELIQAWLKGG
jgi:hypothetical protein